MNERIEKLADEAAKFSAIMALPTGESGDKLFVEKFAQLIVQECMAQCEQVASGADAVTKSEFVTDAGRMLHEGMWGGAKNCSGQIKEHFFGVEK
jgi:hypothetical protein